jgi:FkbM family methyltransferase
MNFHSQHGEDRWIAENIPLPAHGLMVEVGVGRWKEYSNSLHFEDRGWETILVEPHPDLHTEIRANRRGKLFACAAGDHDGVCNFVLDNEPTLSGLLRPPGRRLIVPIRTLTAILDESEVRGQIALADLRLLTSPVCIDVLSIDTEGTELDVWRGLDLSRYRPHIVIIEFATIGLPEDPMAIIRRLLADGYALVHLSGGNLIFQFRDLPGTW